MWAESKVPNASGIQSGRLGYLSDCSVVLSSLLARNVMINTFSELKLETTILCRHFANIQKIIFFSRLTLIFLYFCAAMKALRYMQKYILPHGLQLAGAVSGKDSHISSKTKYIYICGRTKKKHIEFENLECYQES